MSKNCPYPDQPCEDRYLKSSDMKLKCRLDEWKKKIKRCPYNLEISSCNIKHPEQTKLK